MLDAIADALDWALGLDRDELTVFQMALRAVVVYGFTLAVIRMGSKRFLGRASAFDVIVAIMLGSVMSRAITGASSFFATLAAGAVIVGMHWLFAVMAVRFDWFGSFVKGTRTLLVEHGDVKHEAMEKSGLTNEDLLQALREKTKDGSPDNVAAAYLERDGAISVVPEPEGPQVVDVQVRDGVQTVRIEVA